jgi:diguanylate cyclase (GGDEF)-like protein
MDVTDVVAPRSGVACDGDGETGERVVEVDGADGRSGRDLAASLADADSPVAAADAVVSYLRASGIAFPSLYLEQAGRLRCLAQRGYWQVLDGIPSDVGVIGRAFCSGTTVEISDAGSEEEFLFADPDLKRQISVPIRYDGRVVGSLNVESRSRFPDGTRALVEATTAAFELRLEELGGPPAESTAQRVARLATAMTEFDREEDVWQSVLDAATQLAGVSTAAVIEPDGLLTARVVAAVGPLSQALGGVAPTDLGQLDGWVEAGSSLVASGTGASDILMHARLQSVGVAALAVVPLTVSAEHLGSLIVASETPQEFAPVVLPSLEILGGQAAASIRAVRTMAELRQRARRDPLTELGHHATFQEELRAQLAAPHGDRRVALLLIDVDDFKLINDREGHREGDRVLRELSANLSEVLRDDDRLYRVGGDEFATIIEVDELAEAQNIACRMIQAARKSPATISVGIAVAAAGEAADDLVDRADAAMYTAKRSGRDTAGLAPETRRAEAGSPRDP